MTYFETINCEEGLYLNPVIQAIIDTKKRDIYFKSIYSKELMDNLCVNCNDEKKQSCDQKKEFEIFLK